MGEVVKMYFKGDSGIKNPIDLEGNLISEGDILTRDFGDYEKHHIDIKENYKTEPFYKVKINEKGGFYAESIEPCTSTIETTYFYLHDFRFKFCLKING